MALLIGERMEQAQRVDLAHVPSFRLGRLTVHPAVHQLRRDDGAEEVLQHRVMQVLVVLARANGAVVPRNELTTRCWNTRVVGEDSINRVLSRLRSAAAGIGAGSFRIETVKRVGYRLLREGEATPEAVVAEAPGPSRRGVLIGASAAVAIAAAGGLIYTLRAAPGEAPVPPEVAALMRQAEILLGQGTPEATGQAIGLLRRVVERAPDYADGWGGLAVAYGWSYSGRGTRTDVSIADQARAAIARARALDPDNAAAMQAELHLSPMYGHWADYERRVRDALSRHPDHVWLLFTLGWTLGQVGRWREALAPLSRIVALEPSFPSMRYFPAMALWSANRTEEAGAALRQAGELFPNYFPIWFGRFDFLLATGRPGEAIAFAEDREGRPPGIRARDFDDSLLVARALQARDPAMAEAAVRHAVEKARGGTGYCDVAIKYGSLLGRLDDAFAVADALYFGRGFDPGGLRYTSEQALRDPRGDRRTYLLFTPLCAALRGDSRFDALVEEIGLTRYWAETGTRPDYRS